MLPGYDEAEGVVTDQSYVARDLHPVARDQLPGLVRTLDLNSRSFGIQFAQAWIVQTIESRLVGLLVRGFDLPKRMEVEQMFVCHPGCHVWW